jgi:uncharacterized protein (TIGR02996 family)
MDDLQVLKTALGGWRRTKHPRWAQLAEWATRRVLAASPERPLIGAGGKKADTEAWFALLDKGDPLDVPRLLTALGAARSPVAAERVQVLARRDDPRVVTGLLVLLGAPPYRARTALNFFRATCAALGASGDVRARDGLRDLGARYKGVLETTMGDEVGALCRRTVDDELATLPSPALTADGEAQVATLEARYADEQAATTRTAGAATEQRRSEADALATVYAHPDDDGARLVFADVLTERGDERGEFISLQVERARTGGTRPGRQRERALAADRKRRAAWSLPLSAGGECRLERGFPVSVALNSKGARSVVGNEAWATVRRISNLDQVSLKVARELLATPQVRHVRELLGVTDEVLELIPTGSATALGLTFFPSAAQLARFPGLRELHLTPRDVYHDGHMVDLGRDVLAAVPQLQVLALHNGQTPAPAALASVPGLRELTLRTSHAPTAQLLQPLTQLEQLTVFELDAQAVHGLPLTHLSCHRGLSAAQLPALLETLPRLDTLQVSVNHVRGEAEAFLSVLRTTKLRKFVTGHLEVTREPEGTTLELRGWATTQSDLITAAAAAFPPGEVRRAVVRPTSDDLTIDSQPVMDHVLQQLRQAFPGAQTGVDWS